MLSSLIMMALRKQKVSALTWPLFLLYKKINYETSPQKITYISYVQLMNDFSLWCTLRKLFVLII